jgi:hypothetical protein
MQGELSYWDVQIEIVTVNDKGKERKKREHHLIWASDCTGAEKKAKDYMDGTPEEWTVKSIKKSDIIDVYGKE